MVVTAQDVTNAEYIVAELKANFVTRHIVNLVDSKKYGVMNQHQVEGFPIDGHIMKAMKDKTIVNYENKTVQTSDLKATWNVENFYEEYYLYRRAYIQAYTYYKADEYYVSITPALKGFKVLPPQFIVCDSTNYHNPLIYTLTEKDLLDAYEGFEHRGKKYPGVKEILENLTWCLETNTWNISRKNYLTNGIVRLTE